MTRIIFYTNLSDKQQALTVLVEKALAKKHAITVFVNDEREAETFSQMLWQSEPTSFLPNVIASHALAEKTPVVIDWQEKQLCQDDILINLTQTQLTAFSRFRQLIELVGTEEQDKTMARGRYKFYRDRGYEIKHFDEQSLMH